MTTLPNPMNGGEFLFEHTDKELDAGYVASFDVPTTETQSHVDSLASNPVEMPSPEERS